MIGGVLGMSCAFVGGFILAAVGVTIWQRHLHCVCSACRRGRLPSHVSRRVVFVGTSLFSAIPFVGSLAASCGGSCSP